MTHLLTLPHLLPASSLPPFYQVAISVDTTISDLKAKESSLATALKAATAASEASQKRANEAEKKLHALEDSSRDELEEAHAVHAEELKVHLADQVGFRNFTAQI